MDLELLTPLETKVSNFSAMIVSMEYERTVKRSMRNGVSNSKYPGSGVTMSPIATSIEKRLRTLKKWASILTVLPEYFISARISSIPRHENTILLV